MLYLIGCVMLYGLLFCVAVVVYVPVFVCGRVFGCDILCDAVWCACVWFVCVLFVFCLCLCVCV